MTLGHLEHDIRQLGDVIACQITAHEVVVLVRPGADPDAVGAAVERILLGAASHQHLRVLGGTPSPARFPARRLRVVVAGSAGAAMLTAAAVAAAVTGVFRSESPRPTIQLAAPATSEGTTRPRGVARSPLAPGELTPVPESPPAPEAAPAPAPEAPVAAGPQLVVVPLPVELVGAVQRERRPTPAPVPAPPAVTGAAPTPSPPVTPSGPPPPPPPPPPPVTPVVATPAPPPAQSPTDDNDDDTAGVEEHGTALDEHGRADGHRQGGDHQHAGGHGHSGAGHHGEGDG